jgi:hypothetical protein
MKERSLNLQELLIEIDNGSVTSTKQLDFHTRGTVHNKPDLISGNSFQDSKGLVTNKNNLMLTKKGTEHLKMSSFPLEDIDNSYGKDSFMSRYGRPIILFCVLGLIGFSSKWVWNNKLSTAKAPEKSVQKTNQEKSNQSDSKYSPK